MKKQVKAKGKRPSRRTSSLKNVELFIKTREKVLDNFKSKKIPVKNPHKTPTPELAFEVAPKPAPDPTVFCTTKNKRKAKRKISLLKLPEEFLNELEMTKKINRLYINFSKKNI